ncbi:copper oxidase [Sphaerisporangium album]|uniref:Copper oxidase n=1 Tax=Sphaerisporangium album TaxID=509200 RepID=A0A367FEB6_9ACTN|nr:multicopper oxidase domain-containing protein [Sphaerisporangium album]RCG28621.1 copper oxidase [Sphaerisporangium album]
MLVRKALRAVTAAAALVLLPAPQAHAAPPESGVSCTTGPSFDLAAADGAAGFPDGNTVHMWSYTVDGNAFQLPGPVLCVTEGDVVTVTLRNTLPEPVSLFVPGMTGVTADGSPAQPQFTGGTLTSLVQAAPPGGTVTYRFTASAPGTYLYASGTDPAKQVQMGLYGALIVRPAGHPDRAYGTDASRFNPAAEYISLLSEVDPDLHAAVENGRPYDVTKLHPRYWLINGRSFPDTIAPNGAGWLPSQPYGSLIHIRPKDPVTNPHPALVRYLNAGDRIHPFHPHGNHGRVIGRDAHTLVDGADLSAENFLADIGPGQTWDVTYDWTDVEKWRPGTNPIPVPLPQQQNLVYKDDATWYGGSPYLGVTDGLPVGVTSYNECGEYYQMWHSHALNEAANYEAGFGGMMTLERVDPPGGCS